MTADARRTHDDDHAGRQSIHAAAFAVLAAWLAVCRPALAQISLEGEWTGRYQEDSDGPRARRRAGATTRACPINEAARFYADSWDISRGSVPEHQCQVYNVGAHLSRPAAVSHLERERSRFAGNDRHPPVSRHVRAVADDLDGRPPASARVHAAHVDGILNRRVARRRPGRDDLAHQGRVPAPRGHSLQRSRSPSSSTTSGTATC